MTAKPRTRAQILESLRKPTARQPVAGKAKTAAVRRLHSMGQAARDQVSTQVARTYRQARLKPLARPMPIGVGAALAVGAAMAFAGAEVFLVAIAVPAAWLLAYGAADGAATSAARRQAREEIELASAFDRLVDASARELPESARERLGRIKALLVRLLPELPQLRESGALAGDDAFFVRQTVVRYVPDALGPFLALSAEGRSRKTADGDDPVRLLDEQLDLLASKLAALSTLADKARLDTLRRNRAFLDRKVG